MTRGAVAPARPRVDGGRPGPTVADAMITDVKISAPGATLRELRHLFDDEHVHAAVIVEDGLLVAVVDRLDLVGDHRDGVTARDLGRTHGRIVAPDADLEGTWRFMIASGRRRLAVVTDGGRLCGLLCLKRSRSGFCSDRDVHARRSPRDSTPR